MTFFDTKWLETIVIFHWHKKFINTIATPWQWIVCMIYAFCIYFYQSVYFIKVPSCAQLTWWYPAVSVCLSGMITCPAAFQPPTSKPFTDFRTPKKYENLQNKLYPKEHCLEAEYSSYAQECKKNGGHFKCCATGFRLDKWHLIRHELKKRNLIENGPQNLYCGKGWSGDKDGFCYIAAGRQYALISHHSALFWCL